MLILRLRIYPMFAILLTITNYNSPSKKSIKHNWAIVTGFLSIQHKTHTINDTKTPCKHSIKWRKIQHHILNHHLRIYGCWPIRLYAPLCDTAMLAPRCTRLHQCWQARGAICPPGDLRGDYVKRPLVIAHNFWFKWMSFVTLSGRPKCLLRNLFWRWCNAETRHANRVATN